MPLTTDNYEELPMANQDIDISQELLNRLDSELIALTRQMFEAQGMIMTLKFISDRLRENQGAFTQH
jgi:hypothetical protein